MKIYNKIYWVTIVIGIVIINGCSSYIVPLKGKYADRTVEITTAASVDSTWLMINQLFTEKGLPVKKSVKEKGVIITAKSSFIPAYTFEDNDGKLVEPEAWIVLREVMVNKKKWVPKKIFCEWNIQITETEKGMTTIKIAPIVICTYYPNMFTSMEDKSQSTGKLEALITNSFKNK